MLAVLFGLWALEILIIAKGLSIMATTKERVIEVTEENNPYK